VFWRLKFSSGKGLKYDGFLENFCCERGEVEWCGLQVEDAWIDCGRPMIGKLILRFVALENIDAIVELFSQVVFHHVETDGSVFDLSEVLESEEEVAAEGETVKIFKGNFYDGHGRTILIMKPGLQGTWVTFLQKLREDSWCCGFPREGNSCANRFCDMKRTLQQFYKKGMLEMQEPVSLLKCYVCILIHELTNDKLKRSSVGGLIDADYLGSSHPIY
ncbi:hypothetical protein Tco_0715914, partial [Tanacetum coccineum]